jgi:hypothetical protein
MIGWRYIRGLNGDETCGRLRILAILEVESSTKNFLKVVINLRC